MLRAFYAMKGRLERVSRVHPARYVVGFTCGSNREIAAADERCTLSYQKMNFSES